MKHGLAILALLSSIDSVDAFLSLRQSLVCLGSSRSSLAGVKRSKTNLEVTNMGWDNEDFLESLNKGPEAIEEANEQYNRLKKFGTQGGKGDFPPDDEIPAGSAEGAEITAEQVEKIKQKNLEETGTGGEMFKKLMEKAQTGGAAPPSYLAKPNVAVPPVASTPATADLPPGFEQLSPEAQAKVFLELMKNKDQPAPSSAQLGEEATPPRQAPKMRGGVGPDGRKLGRNRDADAIVNSSDVYFAQLKLDSSVRNMARYSGEDEIADKVFADPRISDIKMHVNPHLEDQRKAEKALLDTAKDEAITPDMYAPTKPLDKKDKGVSYKEKLQQKRKNAPSAVTTRDPPQQQKSQSPPPAAVTAPPKTPPAPIQAQEPPQAPRKAKETAQTPIDLQETFEPPTPNLRTRDITQNVSPAITKDDTPKSPEENRREIRTLMGLLLKHRGGPGFGSGRLQGAELERFEKLADDVLTTMRDEAVEPELVSDGSPSGVTSKQPQIPSEDRLNSAVACVEGAIQMYKSSPPDLQSGMLVALHAALVSASGAIGEPVDTKQNERKEPQSVSDGSAPGAISQQPRVPSEDRLNSAVACVEGAIQMFKSSPPELQSGMMVALHAALVSASGTIGELVDAKQNERKDTFRTVTSDMRTRAAPAAVVESNLVENEAIESVSVPEAVSTQAPSFTGTDENTQFLEGVYEKLKRASGPGKMGLRHDFQAESLLDDLAKMRALLVEELDTGIPENGGSSPSKYQQMLSKVKKDRGTA